MRRRTQGPATVSRTDDALATELRAEPAISAEAVQDGEGNDVFLPNGANVTVTDVLTLLNITWAKVDVAGSTGYVKHMYIVPSKRRRR